MVVPKNSRRNKKREIGNVRQKTKVKKMKKKTAEKRF